MAKEKKLGSRKILKNQLMDMIYITKTALVLFKKMGKRDFEFLFLC